MTAGGPGDHPLSDIIHWRRPVYGEATDALIRKIASLCSDRELDDWWRRELGWNATPALAAEKSKARYEDLWRRAQQSGWELREDDVS